MDQSQLWDAITRIIAVLAVGQGSLLAVAKAVELVPGRWSGSIGKGLECAATLALVTVSAAILLAGLHPDPAPADAQDVGRLLGGLTIEQALGRYYVIATVNVVGVLLLVSPRLFRLAARRFHTSAVYVGPVSFVYMLVGLLLSFSPPAVALWSLIRGHGRGVDTVIVWGVFSVMAILSGGGALRTAVLTRRDQTAAAVLPIVTADPPPVRETTGPIASILRTVLIAVVVFGALRQRVRRHPAPDSTAGAVLGPG